MYLIIWKALGLVFVYLMLLIILRALQVLIIDLGGLGEILSKLMHRILIIGLALLSNVVM